jgi:linoleoyl-CoA desaturase
MQPRTSRNPEPEALEAFGRELDEIRRTVEAQVGPQDLQAVRRLDRVSRSLEITGRVLLHFSLDPVTWGLGVGALWIHKQLQATEVGHPALHGAYDRIEGAGRFHSKRFRWDTPIEESSWRHSHNVEHHQYTNVMGRDPDLEFGMIRLSAEVPHQPRNRRQLAHVAMTWIGMGFFMNLHATGLDKVALGDRTLPPDERRRRVRTAAGKSVSYYLYNYVLFPALAGPMFWKVLLGNWLAELMRNVYTSASIFCGHIGPNVQAWPECTKAGSSAHWYAMQVQAANNFEVPYVLSLLCGGLDYQIEHHLFPKLPPRRLRQIAPQVRAACERAGIEYRTGSWGTMLRRALTHLRTLQSPAAAKSGAVANASA